MNSFIRFCLYSSLLILQCFNLIFFYDIIFTYDILKLTNTTLQIINENIRRRFLKGVE
jgi:hypothetical protein